MELFYIILLLVLIFCFIVYSRANWNLPPGPVGIPFIGVYHKLGPVNVAYLKLEQWLKDYKSNIISFYLGSTLIVVLGDLIVMKEALVKKGQIFSGRPSCGKKDAYFGLGLSMLGADVFHEQRQFALSTLRRFGLPRLETIIPQECNWLMEKLVQTNQQPSNIHNLLSISIGNVTAELIFGQRFDPNDQQVQIVMDTLNWRISRRQLNFLNPVLHLRALRWLRYIPTMGQLNDYIAQNEKSVKTLQTFVQIHIEERRKRLDDHGEPANYIDAFLGAIKEQKNQSFNEKQLTSNLISLLSAGTETTATTLRTAILYMACHQDVQDKVYHEIKQKIGEANPPKLQDRNRLPYTCATISEIERVANLAPMSLARSTTEDTELMGYHIPKDALVIPLIWAVHNNETYFPNHKQFNPNRFLQPQQSNNDPHKALIPFCMGKRACLGESVAIASMFLFFTCMLQRFKFVFPQNNIKDHLMEQKDVGLAISPKSFDIIAVPR